MPSPEQLFRAEVDDAWASYLRLTGELDGDRYFEVEPWAWATLEVRLADAHAARATVAQQLAA